MHGRLKIRTSAEEAALKKKEQEKKLVLYRAATAKIIEKRCIKQYDYEMMELTAKILTGNPDVYTMWNIRKECIIELAKDCVDNKQELFDRDLYFTENALQVNPKSYGAWHHRCWILENSPEPNWQKEVDLCTKYLKFDERNFHCWDYRRYVVEKAKISKEHEYEFCTEKIQKNFSNYSSWHYRSKLLPILFPHETDKSRPISEEKLKEELEMVLTAAFTDPNDSSAWFYQRWLLGYSAPEFDIAGFKLTRGYAMISFTKSIDIEKYKITVNLPEGIFEFKDWIPSCNQSSKLNQVWTNTGDFKQIDEQKNNFTLDVINIETNEKYQIIVEKLSYKWFGIKLPKFEYEFGSGVIDVLKEQLSSCNQLLELEPDSKWTILTATLLMRAIDRKTNHSKTLEYLKKLSKVDPMRTGYYQDLSSKWCIQDALEKWFDSKKDLTINLSNLQLTTISYENYLIIFDEINLNTNLLINRNLDKLKTLHMCYRLNLSLNKINSIDMLPSMKYLGQLILDRFDLDENNLFKKCNNISHLKRGDADLLRGCC